METRYTLLRDAVAKLAASADAQVSYLDSIFPDLTGNNNAASHGNDELALEFEDSFIAVGQMIEPSQINAEQYNALRLLDEMLTQWSGPSHEEFWARIALFQDHRWQAIREQASVVLALLPEKVGESGNTRGLTTDRNGS